MERAHRGIELGRLVEVGLSADPGRIHQDEDACRSLPLGVDRIDRGTGRRLDDHALLAE